MATITLSEQKAREIYPKADPEMKSILEESFGGKKFFSLKIMDRVGSIEDIADIAGVDLKNTYFNTPIPDENAYRLIKLFTRVLNEGWVPDYDNGDQRKWFPVFYLNKPGFRFSDSGFVWAYTYAIAGSRQVFASQELSDFAAKLFLDIYEKFYC